MKLIAPLRHNLEVARHLNLVLISVIAISLGLQLGVFHPLLGIATIGLGLLFIVGLREQFSQRHFIRLWVYPVLTIVIMMIDGLTISESGLSYLYPAIYLHLLISRSQSPYTPLLIGFGMLCFLVQLWQPFLWVLTDFAVPNFAVFTTTLISLAAAFLLATSQLNYLRLKYRELLTHNQGLTNYLEQLNQANILLMTTTREGKVSYINDMAKRIFFPSENTEITLPANFIDCAHRCIETGETSTLEFSRSGGSYRLRFSKGDKTGLVNICGEALDKHHQRDAYRMLQLATDDSPECTFVSNSDTQLLYANKVAEALLGDRIKSGDNTSTSWLNVLAPVDREKMRSDVLPSLKQKGVWVGIVQVEQSSQQWLKRVCFLQRTNCGLLYAMFIDHGSATFAPGLVDSLVLKEIADEQKTSSPLKTESAGFVPTTPQPVHKLEEPPSHINEDGPRVLIADDDEINREIASFLLKRLNIAVDYAVNGQEALDRHADRAYDILILDLNMPVVTGEEVARQLSAREGEEPMLVATTANDLEALSPELTQAGFHCYLPKPFKIEVIEAIVNDWQSKKRLKRA